MSSHATLLLLGLFLAVLPYLGFPRAWDDVLVSAAGLACMALAFAARRERSRGGVEGEAFGREVANSLRERAPRERRARKIRMGTDIAEASRGEQATVEKPHDAPGAATARDSEGSASVPLAGGEAVTRDAAEREHERASAAADA